jgi:hypothetical protein
MPATAYLLLQVLGSLGDESEIQLENNNWFCIDHSYRIQVLHNDKEKKKVYCPSYLHSYARSGPKGKIMQVYADPVKKHYFLSRQKTILYGMIYVNGLKVK